MVKNPQNPINVHSLWISPVLWSTLRQTLFIGTDGYAAALNQPKSYYQSVRAFFFVGHMLNDSDFIAYNTDRRFQKIEHSSRARPKMCMGVWRGNGGNGGKRKAARPRNDERKRATNVAQLRSCQSINLRNQRWHFATRRQIYSIIIVACSEFFYIFFMKLSVYD